ncbi:MAG: phage portal protein [Sphingomonadaceae bacterium]
MAWPFLARKAMQLPRPCAAGLRSGVTDPPSSYEARVDEAYARNAIAQRAVRLVSESLGHAPLIVAGEEHPAADLLAPTVRETVATHLLLHGNAFIELGLDHKGQPARLWPLRPERIAIEPDHDGWPKAFLYKVGNRVQRLPARWDGERPPLLHLKLVNPLDDHMGLGCLGAASDAVALLNAAARWNRSLIANAARPSGALVHETKDGAPLSAEQFDRLREEVEGAFQGAVNAGRPMLLEGGLRWQPIALTPAELDFGRAREAAAREIALAFGVPPMLLGLPGDATYANYAQANVALWRLTILPLLGRILEGFQEHLARWWPDLRIEPDLDAIPALWSDREALWRHVAAADFLTVDEKRALLGWGPMASADGGAE